MTDKRKLKELEIGELKTLRQIGEPQLYEDGSTRIPVRWRDETEPLEFGSWVKPKNVDVIQIKIIVPSEVNMGNFFNNFFGGFKHE